MNTDLCFDYGRMKAIAIEDMNEIKRCLALSDFQRTFLCAHAVDR